MTIDEEKYLIDQLNAARGELFRLLTDEERETKRRYGSDYPVTFEDTARALIDGGRDDMAPVLKAFTASLNSLLEHVYEEGTHEKLAKAWAKRRSLDMREGCTTIDDAAAEAMFQIRHALARACPDNYRIFGYCWSIVFRALDTWWGKQQAPVELPVHVARIRKNRPTRIHIDTVSSLSPLKEEEDDHSSRF